MSFITKDDTVLVAIDFQEKLMPAMSNGEETEERAAKLIRGMRMPEFRERLKETGRKNVVICGVEAHICVLQTTLQLMEEGYNVYLVVDCIDSRNENDKLWGISRMGEAGAVITTYESVLYEILQGSKADGFKAISAIVK